MIDCLPARTTRPWLLVALVPALVVAGCGRDAPPPAAGNTGILEAEAANASYPGEYVENGTMQLVNGHYEDSDLVLADLSTMSARGDLDGDGREDLVVLLITSSGGTGIFRDLYLLRRSIDDKLMVSAPIFLGDRIDVLALRIENGEIVADLVVQGVNDPLCCPSQPVSYRFKIAGDEIIETTGQRRVYLKQ